MPDLGGNRWRGRVFRETVGMALQLAGLEEARAVPILNRPAAVFDDEPPTMTHIEGVPGWAFTTHADVRQHRMGPHLDAARQAATFDGAENFAAILHRAGMPSSGAFAVLTVDQLGRLILEAQGASA